MIRSIADIAGSEGQRIGEPQVKIACIEVFALGGPGKNDDAAETGCFAIRSGLAKAVTDAAQHVSNKGLLEKSTPVLIKLIAQISSRFGIQVSEKIAAQSIPVIGAAGGVLLSTPCLFFYVYSKAYFIIIACSMMLLRFPCFLRYSFCPLIDP